MASPAVRGGVWHPLCVDCGAWQPLCVDGGVWQPLLLVVVCGNPCCWWWCVATPVSWLWCVTTPCALVVVCGNACVLVALCGNACVLKVPLITLVHDQHFYVSNLMWWEITDTGFMLYVNKRRFPFMQVYPPLGSLRFIFGVLMFY